MNIEPSPAPGAPQTGTKAIITAVGSAVMAFAMAWVVDSDPFTAKEAVAAGVSALTLGGALGGITFTVPNKAK